MKELETESGIDKRTIAYYVQEGLLPKVGRRGPRTRYPQEILDRLMFIRRVRELQDAGSLRAVTLREIGENIARLPGSESDFGKDARMSAERIRALFVEPDFDTTSMAIPAEQVAADKGGRLQGLVEDTEFETSFGLPAASRRRRAIGERVAGHKAGRESTVLASPIDSGVELPQGDEQFDVNDQLPLLLQEIERRAIAGATPTEGTTLERLIRVPVTESITLSVRNISEADAELVEQLAQLLRRVGGL